MNAKPLDVPLPLSLVVLLGSIAVHIDEYDSADGHELDLVAIRGLLSNPEIKSFIEIWTAKGYLPVKRSSRTKKTKRAK